MKIKKIYTYISAFLLASAGFLTGCTDDFDNGQGSTTVRDKDHLTLRLSISGSAETRAVTQKLEDGQEKYNENKIGNVDLFFYAVGAGDDAAALLHVTEEAIEEQDGANGTALVVKMATSQAAGLDTEGNTSYRLLAIANCPEATALATLPTVNDLKALETKTDEFRKLKNAANKSEGPAVPSSFVMTNFSQDADAYKSGNIVKFDINEGSEGDVEFKRVASKIRVAINLPEFIVDGDDEWYPDYQDIRIFMTSGVRKARLDGTTGELLLVDDENGAGSDYFNITTSGAKETEDYYLSRPLTTGEEIGYKPDGDFPYYNVIPFYSYPNHWEESVTEEHQTWMTIVVPWVEKEIQGTDEAYNNYRAAYYKVPVTKSTDIVSNAYYYVRANINMLGSATPDNPMPVDIDCEIADWGTADDTEAALRPVRYLIFNQTEFVMNNTEEIEIPFSSTHYAMIQSVTVVYYNQTASSNGIERPVTNYFPNDATNNARAEENKTYNPNTFEVSCDSRTNNGKTVFDLKVDNQDHVLKFNHDFNRSDEYSRYDVRIRIRHNDEAVGSAYTSLITLQTRPGIYVSSESIDDFEKNDGTKGAWRNNDGWIMVNGYGYGGDSYTGNLGSVNIHTSDNHVITTFNVTQLSQADKDEWGWVIGDPRTDYINNLADEAFSSASAMKIDDWANKFNTWVSYGNYGGPYDGTQRSGGSSGNRWQAVDYDARTIWEWYEGADWKVDYMDENGQVATWSAKEDKARPLRYYYPASPDPVRENTIAPKFSIVSGHSYDAGSNDDGIRLGARKCATYQQLGYPAGRWRLPTYGEMRYIKWLQRKGKISEVFGGGTNWSSTGPVNSNGNKTTGNAYVRCVYDNWYWEQVDAQGNAWDRIPQGTTTVNATRGTNGITTSQKQAFNWSIFTWGDRPKEGTLNNTRGVGKGGFTAEDYLKQNAPGNYVVVRKAGKVKLEKMKKKR